MKKRFFIASFLLPILCFMSSNIHNEPDPIIPDPPEKGIVYYKTSICYFTPEAGRDITIPERRENGMEVLGFRTEYDPDTQMISGWPVYYGGWNGMETLYLPEHFFYYWQNDFFQTAPMLRSIEVNPKNGRLYSEDGILYELLKSGDKRMICVPRQKELPAAFAVDSNVREVMFRTINGNKSIEHLVFPSDITLSIYAVENNPNLRTVRFEGDVNVAIGFNTMQDWDFHALDYAQRFNPVIDGGTSLREVYFSGEANINSGTGYLHPCIACGENLVRVRLSPEQKKLGAKAFNGRMMYMDLRNVTWIESFSLGWPQAVKLGEMSGEDCMLYPDWLTCGRWNYDDMVKVATRHKHICVESVNPPKMEYRVDRFVTKYDDSLHTNCGKDWTIYVPVEAVEAYEADPYWSRHGEIVAITDKLIPLVSEPTLTLEERETHEYLWDVMPLGNAVPMEDGYWESDNPEVAVIDADGTLHALSPGTANIIFTLEDTAGKAYTAVSEVTVLKEGTGVEEIEAEPVPMPSAPRVSSVPDGVYDLHGRRVADTTEGLVPGLYIVRDAGRTTKTAVR